MGERGPVTKPAQLHVLHGNPSKKPMAALLDDVVRPQVEIPEWPADLVVQLPTLLLPAGLQRERAAGGGIADEARREWDRLTPHLVKLGLISQLDRAVIVMYCFWWAVGTVAKKRIIELGDAALVDVTPSGYKQMGVWLQVASKADGECKQFLAQLGLSPAARSRVTASDPQGSLPGIEKPQEGGWGTFPERSSSA